MTLAPQDRPEVRLVQALIRTASPSGRESAVAAAYARALADLGFDLEGDDAGNVIGRLRCGSGPTVLYNGHLDTVPPGDPERWPHPPLGGVVQDGELWGRGAVDMKGALACMAWGAADAAAAGFRGTLIVTAVVQEEVSGLGARYLSERLLDLGDEPDLVILGEPSGLALMLGHRGRVELELSFSGRIAHAAKPELGDNPLYRVGRFLAGLETLELPSGGPLGSSSVTPTALETEPRDARNVVPGRATLVLDYRTIPGDEPEALCARLQALAPGAELRIPSGEARSENGRVRFDLPRVVPAYLAPGENARVAQARRNLRRSLAPFGLDLRERVWWFATDAPYLASLGAPVIGFGPGDEELAHTSFERVPLRDLTVARASYRDLALGCAVPEGQP